MLEGFNLYIFSKQYGRIVDTDKFDYLETAGSYIQAIRIVDVTTETDEDDDDEEYNENVEIEVELAEYDNDYRAEEVLQQIFKAMRDCQKTFNMPE